VLAPFCDDGDQYALSTYRVVTVRHAKPPDNNPAGRRDPELSICTVLLCFQKLSTLYSTKSAAKFPTIYCRSGAWEQNIVTPKDIYRTSIAGISK
jgi:hypothetical protein